MNIEKKIRDARLEVAVNETDIQNIVRNSKAVFVKREGERRLSYREFLFQQLHMIQKRWWLLQLIVLYLAWRFLESEQEIVLMRRGMGIIAALFVILLIPELWKNLSNHCIEIEMASYYSLRRIYAARVAIFGFVDVFLLTAFSGCANIFGGISLINLITDFLLPLVVTACICFAVLSRQAHNIGMAIAACIIWSIAWWVIAANEKIYSVLSTPIWIAVFVAACMLLLLIGRRLFRNCHNYLEVNLNGTGIE